MFITCASQILSLPARRLSSFATHVHKVATFGRPSFVPFNSHSLRTKSSMTTPDTPDLVETFSQVNIADEDDALVTSLTRLSKASPKLVRSTDYDAPADPRVRIRSWKMNEFKYYDVPSPFPTLARGLFTQDVQIDGQVKHRIVARGYDKFFNIGEVPWTTVRGLNFDYMRAR